MASLFFMLLWIALPTVGRARGNSTCIFLLRHAWRQADRKADRGAKQMSETIVRQLGNRMDLTARSLHAAMTGNLALVALRTASQQWRLLRPLPVSWIPTRASEGDVWRRSWGSRPSIFMGRRWPIECLHHSSWEGFVTVVWSRPLAAAAHFIIGAGPARHQPPLGGDGPVELCLCDVELYFWLGWWVRSWRSVILEGS